MSGAQTTAGSGPAAVIRTTDLTKSYRGQLAVKRLTLAVPEGSVFGLLGENGAGKTTSIRMLLGLLAPDSGRAEVLGLDPARRGLDVRRQVGYVPEVPALYDWMKVSEIGWFAAGFHPAPTGGTAAFQERYNTLTRGFDLAPKKRIKELSKGMRAKVALALALAGDPPLLILDEPTSGLDLMVRREFLESMVDMAGTGRTVLLSSHQISEVERVASHVALLRQGELILSEPIDDLKSQVYVLALTFTSHDHPVAPPERLPLELIDAASAPRQARWLVRTRDRAALEAVRAIPGVETLEIEPSNLEEIYLGYMRARRPERPPAGDGPALAVHVA